MTSILAAQGSNIAGMSFLAFVGICILGLIFIAFFTRYKKCPSDQIMVVFGKTGGHRASRCIHGGAKFIWPIIQDYGFLSLRPVQLEVNLQNALCLQNIRINVPSVFTVGISTRSAPISASVRVLSG